MSTKIKVGDLITAYHAGFHRVVGFHTSANCQQVEYKTVFTSSGKECNKKVKSCHIDFCEVVTEDMVQKLYDEEVKVATQKRYNLLMELKRSA